MDERMLAQRIEQLKQNPEFIEKARKTESVAAFRELLASEGVDIDTEVFESEIYKAGEDEELNETALESVAGGMLVIGPTWNLMNWWKKLITKGSTSHGGGGRSF